MDESSAFAVWGKVARRGIFEAFDDGLVAVSSRRVQSDTVSLQWAISYCFTGAIVSNDEGQWGVKLYSLTACVIEGANSIYRGIMN